MQLHKLALSYIKLHEGPWACMQVHELACSFMSLYAVPFFVWAAHKNFAVLVHIWKRDINSRFSFQTDSYYSLSGGLHVLSDCDHHRHGQGQVHHQPAQVTGEWIALMEDLKIIKFVSLFDWLSCQLIELKEKCTKNNSPTRKSFISMIFWIHSLFIRFFLRLDPTTWGDLDTPDHLPRLLFPFNPGLYEIPSPLAGCCSGKLTVLEKVIN